MASSVTQIDAYLKEKYIDSDRVARLMFPENVLLGMLEKRGDTGMQGKRMPVPVQVTNPQGAAGRFESAQSVSDSAGGNTASDAFDIVAGSYFGVVSIDDKAIMASRTNVGGFLTAKTLEVDSLYETVGENLSIYAWGNGGGSLGVVDTYVSGNNITLTDTSLAGNFEVGMYVCTAAADGAASTDSLDSGSALVTAVNRATGVITVDNALTLSGLATGRNLFRLGDFNGDSGNVIMKGVQAFITASDSPAALWGVTAATRALDPQRWAGCRLASATYAGKGIEERIRLVGAHMTGRHKAKAPTAGFLHPEDWQLLENFAMSKGIYADPDPETEFGYLKIGVNMAGRKVPIYQDRHCPKGTFFALRMENWWLSSMGELVAPMNEDGMEMLRKANAASYELRLRSYPLIACNAPLHNGRVPVGA